MTADEARNSMESRADAGLVAWLSVDRPPILAPSGLHLWLIRANGSPPDPQTLLGQLGEAQRRRAARMTRPDIRGRYIQAQAGLRRILGAYLDCAPVAIVFSHGPAGKPALTPHDTDLEVNLTTTGDIALVAVRFGLEVGIDCERIRPRSDLDGIARRMFSPAEVQALAQTPEPRRLERFHYAWTALEADCKCDGRGLFRPREPNALFPRIAHFRPLAGYVAAVAGVDLPPPDRWTMLELIAE